MFSFPNVLVFLESLFAGYQAWASTRPVASQDAQHAQVAGAVIAAAAGALQAHAAGVAAAPPSP